MGRSVSTPCDASAVAYFHWQPEDGYNAWLEWQDLKADIQDSLLAAFPSLWVADHWLGREDHCFAENYLARITISEYCGLVAVCLVPREDVEPNVAALAEHWCAQIEPRWRKIISPFGEPLAKVGTFSNGEAVFRRIAA